jgi:hypothetical protein
MGQNSQLSTVATPQPHRRQDEVRPGMLIRTLPLEVWDVRGPFHPRVVARELGDGTWEAWLEFVPVATNSAASYVTSGETRQHSRTAVERWASGITRIYAEGALARAVLRRPR